jgi:hypothetical protein
MKETLFILLLLLLLLKLTNTTVFKGKKNSYTQFWYNSLLVCRIPKYKLANNMLALIALDSTGIKVANRGEWMRHKWHIRKGYLKIHITVDIKKKRISENTHNS